MSSPTYLTLSATDFLHHLQEQIQQSEPSGIPYGDPGHPFWKVALYFEKHDQTLYADESGPLLNLCINLAKERPPALEDSRAHLPKFLSSHSNVHLLNQLYRTLLPHFLPLHQEERQQVAQEIWQHIMERERYVQRIYLKLNRLFNEPGNGSLLFWPSYDHSQSPTPTIRTVLDVVDTFPTHQQEKWLTYLLSLGGALRGLESTWKNEVPQDVQHASLMRRWNDWLSSPKTTQPQWIDIINILELSLRLISDGPALGRYLQDQASPHAPPGESLSVHDHLIQRFTEQLTKTRSAKITIKNQKLIHRLFEQGILSSDRLTATQIHVLMGPELGAPWLSQKLEETWESEPSNSTVHVNKRRF